MEGRYLYCIADGDQEMSLGKIGIEGNEVYAISYEDLCAVVHNCSAQLYKSEDNEIVKNWIILHQNVVDAAWEKFGTVLPVSFDTMIKGEESSEPDENMKNWLKEDYENLKEKMDKVRDKAEYGVQIFWDPKIIGEGLIKTNEEIRKIDQDIKSRPRGIAYMHKQKLEGLLKKEMEKKANQCFKDFYKRIRQHVDDIKVEKTKKVDKKKQMLMNLSCLIYKNKSKELGEELEKIDKMEEFSIRFTGPWPPYSFT